MLNNQGFDLWADGYDKSVNLSEESNQYPFAGYKKVLNTIYNIVHTKEKASILDIGFGTGTLTSKLYEDGYLIHGVDFSAKMIDIAKKKMPCATLYQYDFTMGLPQELENEKFDYIISTYAIHHLTDESKVQFLSKLTANLSEGGEILVGDVAFQTREMLEQQKVEAARDWDCDEIYIVFDELIKDFDQHKISFEQISHCAGVVRLKK